MYGPLMEAQRLGTGGPATYHSRRSLRCQPLGSNPYHEPARYRSQQIFRCRLRRENNEKFQAKPISIDTP